MSCFYFDVDDGLQHQVPCAGDVNPGVVAPALEARPARGWPAMPKRGDKVFVSRRQRYDTVGDWGYRPLQNTNWGTHGVVQPTLTPTDYGASVGIIKQVVYNRPGVRSDKTDALGVPYGTVVYPGIHSLTLRCMFLEHEMPALGSWLYFISHGTIANPPGPDLPGLKMTISDVTQTWTEGEFCGGDLALIGGQQTRPAPLAKITGLG